MFQINWKLKAFLYKVFGVLKLNLSFYFIQKYITKRAKIQIKQINKLWVYHADSIEKNNVKNILGSPSQTQFIAEKWVWKYSLHQVWKGFVPYYLIFGKDDNKLKSWYADEAEYMRMQQLWLQAIPPTQKYEVDVKVQ